MIRFRAEDADHNAASVRAKPSGGPQADPRPRPKGARIHLQRGDTVLDVECADDETMKTCADLTLQMPDRLQGPKT